MQVRQGKAKSARWREQPHLPAHDRRLPGNSSPWVTIASAQQSPLSRWLQCIWLFFIKFKNKTPVVQNSQLNNEQICKILHIYRTVKERRRCGGDWGGRRGIATPKPRRVACWEVSMMMLLCAPGARPPGSKNSPLNRLLKLQNHSSIVFFWERECAVSRASV